MHGATGMAEEQTVDDVQPGKSCQKRALRGKSHRSGTSYRWNKCRGWRELEPGCKDELADPPVGGQAVGHCGARPSLRHREGSTTGTFHLIFLSCMWSGLMACSLHARCAIHKAQEPSVMFKLSMRKKTKEELDISHTGEGIGRGRPPSSPTSTLIIIIFFGTSHCLLELGRPITSLWGTQGRETGKP
jgi:hypothetical protein